MTKPSETKDYYERLGISKNASIEEINRAYRREAQIYHPDHNLGREKESELEFIAIGEAYEKLTKPEKEYSGENGFNYYDNLFNMVKSALKITRKMEESEDPKTKEFGKFLSRCLGRFFQ